VVLTLDQAGNRSEVTSYLPWDGSKVLMRSDHAAPSFLQHIGDSVAQQARGLDFIEQFNIRVQHRSGSAHRAGTLFLIEDLATVQDRALSVPAYPRVDRQDVLAAEDRMASSTADAVYSVASRDDPRSGQAS